jgi:UDP-glucose-4-epimerase GalE
MRVLVTGAAGFIGSHASLRLLGDGHEVVGVDNLVRGRIEAVRILESLARGRFAFDRCDLAETDRLGGLLRGVDLVLHFGALAYVGESVAEPLRYWRANLVGTLSLLEAMRTAGVGRLVFSSTCATYGEPPPERVPIDEGCPQAPVNPYGASKLACERVVREHLVAERAAGRPFAAAMLRYFNVAGADGGGRIGEDHRPETHLIPICLEVALGRRPELVLFGDDWPTPDRTCIRDYVHVEDLVDAHLRIADRLVPGDLEILNVGSGRGHSVREVVACCAAVTGRPIPVRVGPRREGDPPRLVAAAGRIRERLGWRCAKPELSAMVEDAWRWRERNPDGYPS